MFATNLYSGDLLKIDSYKIRARMQCLRFLCTRVKMFNDCNRPAKNTEVGFALLHPSCWKNITTSNVFK